MLDNIIVEESVLWFNQLNLLKIVFYLLKQFVHINLKSITDSKNIFYPNKILLFTIIYKSNPQL